MSTPEPSTESTPTITATATAPPSAAVPSERSGSSRVVQIAAWTGIVAGVVFTVAVVFFSGFYLGKNVSDARPGRGYHNRDFAMLHHPFHPMHPMGPMGPGGPGAPGFAPFPGPGGPGGSQGSPTAPPAAPGGPGSQVSPTAPPAAPGSPRGSQVSPSGPSTFTPVPQARP